MDLNRHSFITNRAEREKTRNDKRALSAEMSISHEFVRNSKVVYGGIINQRYKESAQLFFFFGQLHALVLLGVPFILHTHTLLRLLYGWVCEFATMT